MSKIFDVTIIRIPNQSCMLRVSADTRDEAETKAMAVAGDQDYTTTSVRFEVDAATHDSVNRPKPIKILVTVSGGCVQTIACSPVPSDGIEAVLVDFDDNPGEANPDPDLNVWFSDGQTARRFFEQLKLDNPNYQSLF